jgi:DNA-binding CsgD family transcriptional regulator
MAETKPAPMPSDPRDLRVAGLAGFAEAVAAIGTPRFDAALLEALQTVAGVDFLAIVTYRQREGVQTLCVASRSDLATVRSLTHAYVARHHAKDPNFATLSARMPAQKVLVQRHDPARITELAYEQRFFRSVGTVDKLAYLWWAADTGYYVNLYRHARSGGFGPDEARRLAEAASFVASLVQLHGQRRRLGRIARGGDAAGIAAALVEMLDPRLTPRERLVLSRTLGGLQAEGIAAELGVKPSTVVTFRKRAYAKLGISRQAELLPLCLAALP